MGYTITRCARRGFEKQTGKHEKVNKLNRASTRQDAWTCQHLVPEPLATLGHLAARHHLAQLWLAGPLKNYIAGTKIKQWGREAPRNLTWTTRASSWVGPPGKLQAASARARKSEKVSSGWARPKNFYIY